MLGTTARDLLLQELLTKHEVNVASVEIPERDTDFLNPKPLDVDDYYRSEFSAAELICIYLTDDPAERRARAALLALFEHALDTVGTPPELLESLKGDIEEMLQSRAVL